MTAKIYLLDTGEIAQRTFRDSLANGWGPKTLANEIDRIRVLFRFAVKNQLIQRPVEFGDVFNMPSQKVLRKHRAAQGQKMFEPSALRQILGATRDPINAMVLLRLNSGLGNSDVSDLPLATLKVAIKTGWLEFHRVKTATMQRILLSPETIDACGKAIARRALMGPGSNRATLSVRRLNRGRSLDSRVRRQG